MRHDSNAFAAALVLAVACGATRTEAPPATTPASSPSGAGATESAGGSESLGLEQSIDFCVRLHEQAVPCAGEFIDVILELREKYFPEFAAQMVDDTARARIREKGIEETLVDGTGPVEPRRDRCKEYVVNGPPTPRSVVSEAEACYTATTCEERMGCLRPLLEARFAERAALTAEKDR